MDKNSILKWIGTSVLACLATLFLTVVFNEIGAQVGDMSAEEESAWEQFYHDFPEKEVYSQDEFDERSKAIDQIYERFEGSTGGPSLYTEDSHFFLRETALNSLWCTWVIWLMLPIFLNFSFRSFVIVPLAPLLFMAVGIFYAFEVAVFIGAYCAGIACRGMISREKGGTNIFNKGR